MDKAEMLNSMIAEYRKKIETYQVMIAEWERELGGGSQVPQPLGSSASDASASSSKKGASGDVPSLVREFQFFNKSQPEATKLLLEIVGHPLRTSVIIAGIEKGGVTVGGKTPKDKKQNFYTILSRSAEFARFAKDTWGLASWPGAPKKEAGNGGKEAPETENEGGEEVKEERVGASLAATS